MTMAGPAGVSGTGGGGGFGLGQPVSTKPREASATRRQLTGEEVEEPTSSGLIIVYHAVKTPEGP